MIFFKHTTSFCALFVILLSTISYPLVLLIGNEGAPAGTTFSFPINKYISGSGGTMLYVGALTAGTAQDFALSKVDRNSLHFRSLVPEKVTVNNTADQPNPLYNSGISFLDVISVRDFNNRATGVLERVVAVTNAAPSNVYLIENQSSGAVLSVENVRDSSGQPTPNILALTATMGGNTGAFVAVANQSGTFTGNGSGIALLNLRQEAKDPEDPDKKREIVFVQTDGQALNVLLKRKKMQEEAAQKAAQKDIKKGGTTNKEAQKPQPAAKKEAPKKEVAKKEAVAKDKKGKDAPKNQEAGNNNQDAAKDRMTKNQDFDAELPMLIARAAPLGLDSNSIKIGNNVTSISNVIDLWWDEDLRRLYVALQVESGASGSDGARALVVGMITSGAGIHFIPIAPDAVFTGQNQIVGTQGANAQVGIHYVRTFKTTTSLDYLVVVGGNGSFATTKRSVYALPLTNTMNGKGVITEPAIHGTLANKNEGITQYFSKGQTHWLLGRVIKTPATTSSQVFTSDITDENAPALVGGGPLQAGDIDDVMISQDTVFVRVTNPEVNQLPGVFYSQALLDDQGKIKGWTSWQRIAGTTDPVFGFSYDYAQGNFTLMFGADATHITTVERTAWGLGDQEGLLPLTTLLNGEFPRQQGGIQGFFDLPRNAPALDDISLQIATGLGKVALVQTGQLIGGTFTPITGNEFSSIQRFNDGHITENSNARVVTISGGLLDDIGPISSAEIAQNGNGGNQGFLCVGGTKGLLILVQPNGQGWDTATGLGNNLSGLTTGMAFIQVGAYTFIQKLIYDDGFLYVLTDKYLDRIDMTDPAFPATRLTTVESLPGVTQSGALLDLIVSDKVGFLATSVGLFRVSSGNNIQTAQPGELGWSLVTVPEGYGPVTALRACSVSGRAQDVAREQGGMLYALSSYVGKYEAQVNRFTINAVDSGPIDENTMQPVLDERIEGRKTCFINFGSLRNDFMSNGTLSVGLSDRDLTRAPFAKAGGFVLRNFTTLPLVLNEDSLFATITRNAASGVWMMAGDMGLRVNE